MLVCIHKYKYFLLVEILHLNFFASSSQLLFENLPNICLLFGLYASNVSPPPPPVCLALQEGGTWPVKTFCTKTALASGTMNSGRQEAADIDPAGSKIIFLARAQLIPMMSSQSLMKTLKGAEKYVWTVWTWHTT